MNSSLKDLQNLLLEGDKKRSVSLCSELLESGVSRERIILESVESAMAVLDSKCTAQQFNLLEIMLTGRAVMACMKVLFPPEAPPTVYRATLVLASLKGDVHDLGKNIFKAVCIGAGYEVIDCGKDCPPEVLATRAAESNAGAACVSGLISSVVPQVKQLKDVLENHELSGTLCLAGGAALRQLPAETLNVDFVAQDAFEGLHWLNKHFPKVDNLELVK
jgi:methanogenic corrinoid protein MtbC1